MSLPKSFSFSPLLRDHRRLKLQRAEVNHLHDLHPKGTKEMPITKCSLDTIAEPLEAIALQTSWQLLLFKDSQHKAQLPRGRPPQDFHNFGINLRTFGPHILVASHLRITPAIWGPHLLVDSQMGNHTHNLWGPHAVDKAHNFPFPVLCFLTSLCSQEFPLFPVWLCQLLGCTQQAYKVSACPASRPEKGPRVSNRDIKGLIDWGAYTSEERSYINTTTTGHGDSLHSSFPWIETSKFVSLFFH